MPEPRLIGEVDGNQHTRQPHKRLIGQRLIDVALRHSGMERALAIVTQWRDVPAAAVDAVKETRLLFLSALSDDLPNPLWLRPEWLGLAPVLQRFRRRRRIARRRLTDPDYSTASSDDDREQTFTARE